MIVIDSQAPPAPWKTGDGGRPSRPTITRRGAPGGLLLVELDCGHTFLVDEGALVDGWGEQVYSCPFGHVIIQKPGRPTREVAWRAFEAEEKLRRARRLAEGDAGARLLMEMETLLREMDDYLFDREDNAITIGCGFEPDCDKAGPDDVNRESRPCWRCRRRSLLERLDRLG